MSSFSAKPWHEFENLAFDVDGTLLNSNIAHVWAWQDAFESENVFFPYLTLFLQMGLPGKHIIEKFSYVVRDRATAERIALKAGTNYSERYVDLVAPFAGTPKLLAALKARGRRLFAITSASRQEADATFLRFKLGKYFEHVLTSEEVEQGKPSPEPFLALKDMLGLKTELISLGDSPYDYRASTAAGIPFVYLGQGGFPREWFELAYARFFNVNELLLSMRQRRQTPEIGAALASLRPSVPKSKAS